jgi:hypothetical protein
MALKLIEANYIYLICLVEKTNENPPYLERKMEDKQVTSTITSISEYKHTPFLSLCYNRQCAHRLCRITGSSWECTHPIHILAVITMSEGEGVCVF